mgnify:CR=1 FL=1
MEENKKHVPNYEISTYQKDGNFTYSPNQPKADTSVLISYFRDRSAARNDNKNTGGANDGTNKTNK